MFERLIHPALTPDRYQEPRWGRFLFASTTAAWIWLVVRLYMAYIFLPAGWGKITGGKWLFGDGSPINGMVSHEGSRASVGRRDGGRSIDGREARSPWV